MTNEKSSIYAIIEESLNNYSSELAVIEGVAKNRYNGKMYLNYGEYDWFSGVVLYCLIRYQKPEKILEVSTGSGFSSSYMALALKKNGFGTLDTFEILPDLYNSAKNVFKLLDVESFVNPVLGDAQKILSNTSEMQYDILFLDSLHVAHFTKWFIKNIVLNNTKENALVHFHDVMPIDAKVRMWGGPPIKGTKLDQYPSIYKRTKKLVRRALGLTTRPETEFVRLNISVQEGNNKLQTFDGNQTSESVYVNFLLEKMNTDMYCYLHHIADHFPDTMPRKYDHSVLGRQDKDGKPFEWNEAVWTTVSALKSITT